MRAALFTSVSGNIAELAALTVANKLEYCLRHGYSLHVDNQPYEQAVAAMANLTGLLDVYDLVWSLDADAVITDMGTPFHELPCLGPHVTACEEGIVDWNLINCGSVVWRNTPQARHLLTGITVDEAAWRPLPCGWQTWLGILAAARPEWVTVAPVASFNSCEWTHPGGGHGEPGSHWKPGHLVWHPCGVFPMARRLELVRDALQAKVTR